MVIIMRGVPGSGKSHWAKAKLKQYENDPRLPIEALGSIISADDYRLRTGKYIFDSKETAAAHQYCYSEAYKLLEHSKPYDLLIVDNTNISNWEFTPYVCLAQHHNHEVAAVQVKCSLGVAFERNLHGVPLDTITRMHNAMQVPKTIENVHIINGEDTRTVVHLPW